MKSGHAHLMRVSDTKVRKGPKKVLKNIFWSSKFKCTSEEADIRLFFERNERKSERAGPHPIQPNQLGFGLSLAGMWQ